MDTGYVALTERLPMITEALRAQRIRQGGLMADTIAELPAQVAALDKWARPKLQWLFYGTESGDRLTERTEKLVAYISDIQAKRPPKLTPEEVRNLIVEGRHEMTEIERALVAL